MGNGDSGKAPALVTLEAQPIDIDDVDSHGGLSGSYSESRSRQPPPNAADDLEDAIDQPTVDDHDGDLVTSAESHRLKRGLAERHLSMLGIAGAIGTGLFLSLGGAIQTGGPLGALLGYAIVGGIVCAVQFALGEVTALLPVR